MENPITVYRGRAMDAWPTFIPAAPLWAPTSVVKAYEDIKLRRGPQAYIAEGLLFDPQMQDVWKTFALRNRGTDKLMHPPLNLGPEEAKADSFRFVVRTAASRPMALPRYAAAELADADYAHRRWGDRFTNPAALVPVCQRPANPVAKALMLLVGDYMERTYGKRMLRVTMRLVSAALGVDVTRWEGRRK